MTVTGRVRGKSIQRSFCCLVALRLNQDTVSEILRRLYDRLNSTGSHKPLRHRRPHPPFPFTFRWDPDPKACSKKNKTSCVCRDDKNDECFHTCRWTAVGTSCQDAVMKPGATPPLTWLRFESDILHWPHFTLSPDEPFENPTRTSSAVVVNPTFAAPAINRPRRDLPSKPPAAAPVASHPPFSGMEERWEMLPRVATAGLASKLACQALPVLR